MTFHVRVRPETHNASVPSDDGQLQELTDEKDEWQPTRQVFSSEVHVQAPSELQVHRATERQIWLQADAVAHRDNLSSSRRASFGRNSLLGR